MVLRWTAGDLDPDCLFEVDYNRDIETASRYSLPIPSMLDERGEPLWEHKSIFPKLEKDGRVVIDQRTGRKDYRFRFKNHKDNTDQGVKIDGTGSIMFMSPSNTKAGIIKNIVKEAIVKYPHWSPDILEGVLHQIYLETGIGDRWNETKSTLQKKYDATADVEDDFLGRFVYKNEISSAVYLAGSGLYDGPADSDQNFHGGAFIIFPGKNLQQARDIISSYDPFNPSQTRGGSKLVQYDVFLQTRRLPDGLPITPGLLKRQEKPKRRYYEVAPIAGFVDYEPDMQAVEGEWLRRIQDVFARYGYPRIKTRAVEDLGILRLEEGTDTNPSRIFEVRPAFAQASRAELGLRFDHTVPLARYIAENDPLGRLVYPFKSARMGPVWRSQDIARGDYREFVQADIDIVGDGGVPLEYDAEFPRVMCDVADVLGIGTVEFGISNRKITKGFFNALGFDDEVISQIIRIIEKRDALGSQGIQAKLYELLKADKALATRCLDFAMIKSTDSSFADEVLRLCKPNRLLEEGIEELMSVIERLQDIKAGSVIADMSIVRGMNYYTGTVYEGRCKDSPAYPPIIVGGRYDSLVGHFMKESRPGVGASFEVTRAMDLMRESGRLKYQNDNAVKALIVYKNPADIIRAEVLARQIRLAGNAVEIAYGEGSEDKRIAYGRAKNIPDILVVGTDENIELIKVSDSSRRVITVEAWAPR